jgi:hypothetical protein
MEWFIKLIVAVGLALMIGLWTVRFTAALGGLVRRVAPALLGLAAPGLGIGRELSLNW